MNIFRQIFQQNTYFTVTEHSASFSLKKTKNNWLTPPPPFRNMYITIRVFLRLPYSYWEYLQFIFSPVAHSFRKKYWLQNTLKKLKLCTLYFITFHYILRRYKKHLVLVYIVHSL